MKPTLLTFAALVVALAPTLGCGSIDEEGPPAQYPQAVGYDAPEQSVASSSAPASSEALQQRMQVQPGQATDGQASIAPQESDVVVGADDTTYADTDPSALTDFRPALDPYGTWVDDATYGTVWVPSESVVGTSFTPYVTAGHWAYDDDYVWVSDYDWGWAPYHYGRWTYLGGRGWGWIPGRTYAGAWVSWRYGYDGYGYVGWAPMPPTWYWSGGIAVGVGFVPPAPYVFCGSHDVFSPVVGSRLVAGAQVPDVASHTRPYVPATPTVAGGHTPATPGVGHAGGPPPGLLHIPPTEVAHAPATDRGVMHAQQFAHPQTAERFGAHPPAQSFAHSTAIAQNSFANPNRNAFASPGVPRSNMPSYGRNAPVATSPQYRGVSPTPYRAPQYQAPQYQGPHGNGAPAYSSAPRYGTAPSYSGAPSYSAPHYSAPSYSAAPHYSAPAYSAPHYSAPSYSAAPHYGGSMPSYGGGSHYGSVAPSSGSHPTYSAPAPHMSGGGGGGFHGGGFSGGGFSGGGARGGGGHR